MNKVSKVLILSGIILIVSAVLLCVYNINQNKKAFENSQTALAELKDIIPEVPESPTETYEEYLKKIEQDSTRTSDDLSAT